MLIDIFGIDGCGKSTQAQKLKDNIEMSRSYKVSVQHGFKPANLFEKLCNLFVKAGILDLNGYEDLGISAVLFDMYNNTNDHIIPKLKNKEVVIMEKYIVDSIVYMPLMGSNIEIAKAFQSLLPTPDISFYIDVPANVAYERVIQRASSTGQAISSKENLILMEQARQNFVKYSKENNVYIIDGTNDVDAIAKKIYNIVNQKLKI